MKRLFETLSNIWKIEELRNRILFTLGLIWVFRLGSFIVLPGVDPVALRSALKGAAESSPNDLLGLINIFSGGAFNNASIFALGIMPYITASIIIQLLGFAVPYFQRLQKDGESGRKTLNQLTRGLTVAITLVQGGAYLAYIKSLNAVDASLASNEFIFWISGIIILASGTIFAMWLGERITDKGIGNGVSLLITVGIIASLPSAFFAELQVRADNGGILMFVIELFILFAVCLATVLIVTGVRRIPIQFAKRMVGRGSADIPSAGARDFIPLKVNAAGVMPIIFAQALMFLPGVAAQAVGGADAQSHWFIQALNNFTSAPYNIIYFLLIVAFTYVYTALIVNPTNYSEYLKRQNAFIPGVKPGVPTEEYIDAITSRITLPGAIFLGLIAIMPAFASAFGVNNLFAAFFGGTSLLILVGVVLDTLQQVETYLLNNKYEGLVKDGRVAGRSGSRMQGIGADF